MTEPGRDVMRNRRRSDFGKRHAANRRSNLVPLRRCMVQRPQVPLNNAALYELAPNARYKCIPQQPGKRP